MTGTASAEMKTFMPSRLGTRQGTRVSVQPWAYHDITAAVAAQGCLAVWASCHPATCCENKCSSRVSHQLRMRDPNLKPR